MRVFPTEVQAIFPTYRDSFAAGLNKVNLQLVQDFGAAVPARRRTRPRRLRPRSQLAATAPQE